MKELSMPNILILGANGQLARNTPPFFLRHPDVYLTLYLRRAQRLKNPDPNRVTIVEGDVLDLEALKAIMRDQDVFTPTWPARWNSRLRLL